MKNVFIINAHQPWHFAEGKLNATMANLAASLPRDQGCAVRSTSTVDD